MRTTPTLQDLALYARDHFGEDGYPFEDSIPSSLDVVVAVYADQRDAATVPFDAGSALRLHLESRGCDVPSEKVNGFVREAVRYLGDLYPDAETLRTEEQQRILCHLFWANLVEMRYAAPRLDPAPRSAESGAEMSQRPVAVGGGEHGHRQEPRETSTLIERETREVRHWNERRQHLVDALNEALPRMYQAYHGTGQQAVDFLQREITYHADAATLTKILQDVKREIAATEDMVPRHPNAP